MAEMIFAFSSPCRQIMLLVGNLRLDSDELDTLDDLLLQRRSNQRQQVASMESCATRIALQEKLGLIERLLERVDEACAMI